MDPLVLALHTFILYAHPQLCVAFPRPVCPAGHQVDEGVFIFREGTYFVNVHSVYLKTVVVYYFFHFQHTPSRESALSTQKTLSCFKRFKRKLTEINLKPSR